MKPQEAIVTHTDLTKFYDFNERPYERVTISYVGEMKCVDKENNQIIQKDIDGIRKSVMLYIFSNKVRLNYEKDIKNTIK